MSHDFPEALEQLVFDFENKCRSYRLADDSVLVIDQNLQAYSLPYEVYKRHPEPHHWVKLGAKMRNQR